MVRREKKRKKNQNMSNIDPQCSEQTDDTTCVYKRQQKTDDC